MRARPVTTALARSWCAWKSIATSLVSCAFVFTAEPAAAQFIQQGAKLVSSNSVLLGTSVAVSANGNTAAVGGFDSVADLGAVWVFTRSNGNWTQQAEIITPGDAIINSREESFGTAVALSADGNTLMIGNYLDNYSCSGSCGSVGAAWIFTNSGGVWSEQTKLTAGDESGNAGFGYSVGLSADGNTAIAGGYADNSGVGAAWIFTQDAGTWSQFGPKLTANDESGTAGFGFAVALSGDGGTALIGGISDDDNVGATWAFILSNGAWIQQGSKLVGSGVIGYSSQGDAVALSGDGNTALVGGEGDDGVGAGWVFTRSAGVWSQQGAKLVGNGYSGTPDEGLSVALSGDGNTAVLGGFGDNDGVGAVWVFRRSGSVWNQLGAKLTGVDASNAPLPAEQGFAVALSTDASTLVFGGRGDNANAGAAWVFIAAPGVLAVTPSSGPSTGGTGVTITGVNFTGATAVNFGAANAASYAVNSDTSISAVAPAGSGVVDVTVTGPAGTSPTSAADQFSYFIAAPVVTSISPNSGPAAGGTGVTITGSNFTGATGVSFGGVGATNVNVVSDASITANAPAGSGVVDVTVSGPGGASETGAADGFSYIAAPAVTSISPSSGPAAGRTIVTIGGNNLANATAVMFGGTAANWFSVESAAAIRASAPAGSGTVDITVVTEGGTSATGAADRFTYNAVSTSPTVTAVSPSGGSPAGGAVVIIAGTNLTGATAVNFGGSAARQFAVNSPTEISAVSPAGSVGTVDITVTTGTGTSATSAADRFSYTASHSTQQGGKLVGSGYSGAADEAFAVSLSSDGNTAVIGGPNDNANAGATWVFTRSGSTWTQAGAKLTGSGANGNAEQGYSVAISGDGSTMLVGGPADNGNAGAVWVLIQSGGSWTQQGLKLTANDEAGAGQFGISVALSNDGNTALVGGSADNSGVGAVWVFTRSGSTWTQDGSKLTAGDESGAGGFGGAVALSSTAGAALIGGAADTAGTGAAWIFTQNASVWSQDGSKLVGSGSVGAAAQGSSVSLSADGNTALVGGFADNSDAGAAWVFTQSGNTWSQSGSKLTGTGAVGASRQGFAVALSADASTAALAGYEDNSFTGAAWVFTQNGGTWSQHGAKLTGTGASGAAALGYALALSSNGRTLLAGGPYDATATGAAWVFTLGTLADSHDFNGDGVSDILWRGSSGDLAMWLMSGGQMSSGATVSHAPMNWSVVGTRDFNGDDKADILWLDGTGDLGLWEMNGATVSAQIGLGNVGSSWSVVGTGDFNGDGTGDILWRDASGDLAIWLMSNGQFSSGVSLGQVSSDWSVAGTGDFNGDGTTDILWRNTHTGDLAIWLMNNGQVSSAVDLANVPLTWSVVGTGDFDGDGTSDILWGDTSGDYAIWLISNGRFSSGATIASGVANTWSVAETGDFDGDGKSDILWIDTSGDLGAWLMNGTTISSMNGLGNVGTGWTVQGQNAD